MPEPLSITLPADPTPYGDEVGFLVSVLVADAASILEDGHDAKALAAALAFTATLVEGKAPESTEYLRHCKRLARKYRAVKLSS